MTITRNILAIDPGPKESAFIWMIAGKPSSFGIEPNAEVIKRVAGYGPERSLTLAIEWIANMGMPAVGAEVFDTCRWVGRFQQAWGDDASLLLIKRVEVKMHLCGSMRAKDPNIRQAIIDLYGGKDAAIGRKKTPGPLYGVSSHVWSALAVALTAAEKLKQLSPVVPAGKGDSQ